MVKGSVLAILLHLYILTNAVCTAVPVTHRDGSCSDLANTPRLQSVTPDTSEAALKSDTAGVTEELSIRPLDRRLGSGILREPLGLAVDSRGTVYAADAMTGKVFRFSRDGESIEFERPTLSASFCPIDLAVQTPFIYVLDYTGNRVLRYDSKGAYLDVLISFAGQERIRPVSLTVGEGGRMCTTDMENHKVMVMTPLLDIELVLGEYGWAEGGFDRPMKASFLTDGRIAVVELGNRRVQVFTASGRYESTLQIPDERGFVSPRSIAADLAGHIFVSDADRGAVYVFGKGGRLVASLDSFGAQPISPAALAVGWDNDLYVADLRSRSILVYRLVYPY